MENRSNESEQQSYEHQSQKNRLKYVQSRQNISIKHEQMKLNDWIGGQLTKWDTSQIKEYVQFIKSNRERFLVSDKLPSKQFFFEMSKQVGSKTSQQCREQFQFHIQNFECITQLIGHLQKWLSLQGQHFEKYLRCKTKQLKEGYQDKVKEENKKAVNQSHQQAICLQKYPKSIQLEGMQNKEASASDGYYEYFVKYLEEKHKKQGKLEDWQVAVEFQHEQK